MAGVSVRVDMREYVPRIRYYAQDKVVRSVREPGIKTQINEEIYESMRDEVPVDTGALEYSPFTNGQSIDFGTSTKQKHSKTLHYANGHIDDTGIFFDPYQISGRGNVTHYASKVRGFAPYQYINENKQQVYDIIRDIIVEGCNNE